MQTEQSSPHVLVLDGSPSVRRLVREVLEAAGYRVSVVADPNAAHAAVEQLEPDLIVLDLVLGEGDLGWRLVQQLRRDRASAAIPIVVCTGGLNILRQAADRLRTEGIPVVTKPFDTDELAGAVRGALVR